MPVVREDAGQSVVEHGPHRNAIRQAMAVAVQLHGFAAWKGGPLAGMPALRIACVSHGRWFVGKAGLGR